MNDMFSVAGSQELLNRKSEDCQHLCDCCLWLGHEGILLVGYLCEHQIPLTADTHGKAEQGKCTLPTDDPKILSSVEEQPWC